MTTDPTHGSDQASDHGSDQPVPLPVLTALADAHKALAPIRDNPLLTAALQLRAASARNAGDAHDAARIEALHTWLLAAHTFSHAAHNAAETLTDLGNPIVPGADAFLAAILGPRPAQPSFISAEADTDPTEHPARTGVLDEDSR
jgi:hypothetical protein